MIYDSNRRNRHSIRIKNYDYSQIGMYYITICSKNRECLFGEINNGKMILNQFGQIVQQEWYSTPTIRKNFCMDEFIIMPNHLHGTVIILYKWHKNNSGIGRGEQLLAPTTAKNLSKLSIKSGSIAAFVAGFKASITKRVNHIRETPQFPIWQRNYYEHIIRNEKELSKIKIYIRNNPINWQEDINNPNKL